jgi:ADP-heptose:LPS heptosyltransferase
MASRLPSRLWVATRALWRWLPTLGRRSPVQRPARVLIAHHLLLGDTLMLTPLLAKLRRNLPDAEIVMATPKTIAPLYTYRPYGVSAIAYDPADPATLRALDQHRGFDLALVPADNRYSWLAAALGARWIVAFAGDRPPYKSWPVDQRVAYRTAPAAWGDLATDLISGDPPPPYDPVQWPAPPVRSFSRPRAPYAVLHVGASTPLKLWPAENWRILAHELTARGLQVVWSGGPREQRIVEEIDPAREFPSLAGTLDLPQMWQLLAGARLLVCPDTGISHLARIVGTPTITLFGPGSQVLSGAGEFWRASPYWPVTVDPFPCRDQQLVFKRSLPWVRRCYRSPRECSDNRCMKSISMAMVTSALEQALASVSRARG